MVLRFTLRQGRDAQLGWVGMVGEGGLGVGVVVVGDGGGGGWTVGWGCWDWDRGRFDRFR